MSHRWRYLMRLARPRWRGLSGSALLMGVGAGLELLQPWPVKLVVDYVLLDQPLPESIGWVRSLPAAGSARGLLAWFAGALMLVFLMQALVRLVDSWARTTVGQRLSFDLGARLFDHAQRLSLTFHGRRKTGDLVRRATRDVSCIRELAYSVALPLLRSAVMLIAMVLIMWQLDPMLTTVALGVALPLVVVIRLFAAPLTRRNYEQQQREGQVMALAEQSLSAIPVIQAFNQEPREDHRFRDLSRRTVGAHLRATRAQLGFKIAASSVTAVGTAGIMVLGGVGVVEGRITLGTLLVFLAYLSSLYAPLETIALLSSSVASVAAKARRVFDVLDADERVPEAPGAGPLPEGPGRVRIEDISFGYEPHRPVLQHVDLAVEPGQTVALVGPTGAGKSTLVSLLPRLADPWRGRILIDGTDIRQVSLRSLRAAVAVAPQDPLMLPISVAQNIAYGCPDAGANAVRSAAAVADADAFIRALPDGYETVLGERGVTLSGGQRQRLAIARAVLTNPRVLILDEPSSALDAESEAAVFTALERVMARRSCFLVAHRLATARRADRIVVLEAGRVVEAGTHAELIAAGGRYRQMHESVRTGERLTVPAP